MKYFKAIFLLVLLSISLQISAETLTESSVENLLSRLETAMTLKEVETLPDYYTDELIITTEFPEDLGGIKKVNNVEYFKNLQEVFETTNKYSIEKRNFEISISEDGQSATATALIKEVMEFADQIIVSESEQVSKIVIKEGKELINSVDAKVTFLQITQTVIGESRF